MFRSVFGVCSLAVAICGLAAADDTDPIRVRLDKARTAYAADLKKAREGLLAAIDREEKAVQQAADLPRLKRVRADREAFTDRGELPKTVSVNLYLEAVAKAKEQLEAACAKARKEYTQAGKLAEAEAIDGELQRLKADKGATSVGATSTDSGAKSETPIPNDGFGEGTEFTGTIVHRFVDAAGKQVVKGAPVGLLVTKRSGKAFSATIPGQFEVEGTIQNGVVKWQVVKALAESLKRQVGIKTFTGTCKFSKDKGEWVLKGFTINKGEQYAGEWELKTKTEK